MQVISQILVFVSICSARSEAPRNRFTYYFFFSGQWSTTLGGGMSFYPKNNWLLVTPQKANSTCQLFSLGRRPPCPSASALPVTLSFGLLSARSLPFTPPSCGSLCVAPDCRQSESPTESPPATAPQNKNGAGAQRNSAGSPPHDQHARKMVE